MFKDVLKLRSERWNKITKKEFLKFTTREREGTAEKERKVVSIINN